MEDRTAMEVMPLPRQLPTVLDVVAKRFIDLIADLACHTAGFWDPVAPKQRRT
jgi:hypothetical protein